jgi:hypothetical protein
MGRSAVVSATIVAPLGVGASGTSPIADGEAAHRFIACTFLGHVTDLIPDACENLEGELVANIGSAFVGSLRASYGSRVWKRHSFGKPPEQLVSERVQ